MSGVTWEHHEIRTCRPYLAAEIAAMPRLTAFLALGTIAHNAILATLGEREIEVVNFWVEEE